MSTSDKNLFINNCLSCHTPSGLENRTADQISATINSGDHGMGTTKLKSLSSTSIAGIARSLVPQTPTTVDCTVCHSSSTPSPTPTPTPTPTPNPGQALYDSKCGGCHSLGTYDTTGSPNLLGRGSALPASSLALTME
jgi:mono/diheme cytochrome c family protein